MKVPPGRLDVMADAMLDTALRAHGNPMLRIAHKMTRNRIAVALTETLGPGTKAGNVAADVVKAATDFQRAFIEAQQQIAAEDRE